MARYRIYVDEVGNHDLTHADDPNQRFLSLTGVILESGYDSNVLQPEMDVLKRRFFQRDPDEPVTRISLTRDDWQKRGRRPDP